MPSTRGNKGLLSQLSTLRCEGLIGSPFVLPTAHDIRDQYYFNPLPPWRDRAFARHPVAHWISYFQFASWIKTFTSRIALA